jgi:hypothetical protein
MVPIHLTVEATRALMGVAFANAESGRKLREKELDVGLARMQIEANTYLEELRIEAETSRVNAQKEVYLALVDLAKHAYDQRMKFFFESFRSLNALIDSHYSARLSELQAMEGKEFDSTLSTSDKVRLFKARADISRDLADLRATKSAITSEFNTRVSFLSPEIRALVAG